MLAWHPGTCFQTLCLTGVSESLGTVLRVVCQTHATCSAVKFNRHCYFPLRCRIRILQQTAVSNVVVLHLHLTFCLVGWPEKTICGSRLDSSYAIAYLATRTGTRTRARSSCANRSWAKNKPLKVSSYHDSSPEVRSHLFSCRCAPNLCGLSVGASAQAGQYPGKADQRSSGLSNCKLHLVYMSLVHISQTDFAFLQSLIHILCFLNALL